MICAERVERAGAGVDLVVMLAGGEVSGLGAERVAPLVHSWVIKRDCIDPILCHQRVRSCLGTVNVELALKELVHSIVEGERGH